MGNHFCKPKRRGESLREVFKRKCSKRIVEKTADALLTEDGTQKETSNVEQLVLEDIEDESFDDVNSSQSARTESTDEAQETPARSSEYRNKMQTPVFESHRPTPALKTEREMRVESMSSGELYSTRVAGDAKILSSLSAKSQISHNSELESESQFIYMEGPHFLPSPKEDNTRKVTHVREYCLTKGIFASPSTSPSVPSSPVSVTRQAATEAAGSQNIGESEIKETDRSSVVLRGGIQQGLRTRNPVRRGRRNTDTERKVLSLEEKIQKFRKRDPSMPGPDKGIVWPKSLDNLSKTNAAYYVEQFLRSELFRQRCLRKLQGSKTWKNGLTPFQLWVIENEDTDAIQDVLHPFKAKPNNTRAKVICWRGQTPPPTTEN